MIAFLPRVDLTRVRGVTKLCKQIKYETQRSATKNAYTSLALWFLLYQWKSKSRCLRQLYLFCVLVTFFFFFLATTFLDYTIKSNPTAAIRRTTCFAAGTRFARAEPTILIKFLNAIIIHVFFFGCLKNTSPSHLVCSIAFLKRFMRNTSSSPIPTPPTTTTTLTDEKL